jgi:uncharacterized protein
VALVVDTGVLFGSLNRRDEDHVACVRLLEGTSESLVVPAPVLVEVDYLIGRWLDRSVHRAFMNDLVNEAFVVRDLERGDYVRVRHLCEQYADFPLGFVDAAVIAIAERLNEPKIATLDQRHFRAIRPRHVDAFELLP